MSKKFAAELFGTFWLVFGGCGAAILAGGDIGYAGIALAFGLTVLTMAYAVGGISGGHFNPAVTLGLVAAGKFDKREAFSYIIAQLVGAIIAAFVIFVIAEPDTSTWVTAGAFATNFYDGIVPAFTIETVLTFFFLIVILGSVSVRVPAGFAPIPIGLALTLIHLISIPITNTSVNPARSSSQAIIVGLFNSNSEALCQLWLFWVAPIIGAVIAGLVYKKLFDRN